MIIATLIEKKLQDCEAHIKKNRQKADLFEVRLDALKKIEWEVVETLEKKYPILWTLRSEDEGGERKILPNFRRQCLSKLIDLQPKYLDLEAKRDQKLIEATSTKSPQTKLVISRHFLKSFPKDLGKEVEKLKISQAWQYKIAVKCEITSDALKLFVETYHHAQCIVLPVGEKVRWMRLLAPIYGKPITFAAVNQKQSNAAFQLTLDELADFRYQKINSKTKVCGLVGYPIRNTMGFEVYNSLFKKKNINALYLNFELEFKELKTFFKSINTLNFYGLSVTIPYKEQLFPYAQGVQKKEAYNTLKKQPRGFLVKNTDQLGAMQLIEKHLSLKDKNVVILGAGGTAKAIAVMCSKKKANVAIYNRTLSKGKALAKIVKGVAYPLEDLKSLQSSEYDLLINATASDKQTLHLVPAKILRAKKLVIDVSLTTSKLVENAKKKNCQVIDGTSFWLSQAILQVNWWFPRSKISINDLEKSIK